MGDNGSPNENMIRFRGRSEHSLDSKGRLNIPARFQDVLRSIGDERLMIVPWEKCIKAYPVPVWEELEEKLLIEARRDPKTNRMVEHMIGGVEECPLKQGRISLPVKMREQTGISKDVVLEGMLRVFRIWDRQTWEMEHKPSAEDFRRFDDRLAEFGIF